LNQHTIKVRFQREILKIDNARDAHWFAEGAKGVETLGAAPLATIGDFLPPALAHIIRHGDMGDEAQRISHLLITGIATQYVGQLPFLIHAKLTSERYRRDLNCHPVGNHRGRILKKNDRVLGPLTLKLIDMVLVIGAHTKDARWTTLQAHSPSKKRTWNKKKQSA